MGWRDEHEVSVGWVGRPELGVLRCEVVETWTDSPRGLREPHPVKSVRFAKGRTIPVAWSSSEGRYVFAQRTAKSPTRGLPTGGKYAVRTKSGRVVGRFDTKTEAIRAVAQLNSMGRRQMAQSPPLERHMSYEEAKKLDAAAQAEAAAASAAMKHFPTRENGLTPDAVRLSPEYRAAKARSERAFAYSRSVNAWFFKTFKKEIRAERAARGR